MTYPPEPPDDRTDEGRIVTLGVAALTFLALLALWTCA